MSAKYKLGLTINDNFRQSDQPTAYILLFVVSIVSIFCSESICCTRFESIERNTEKESYKAQLDPSLSQRKHHFSHKCSVSSKDGEPTASW